MPRVLLCSLVETEHDNNQNSIMPGNGDKNQQKYCYKVKEIHPERTFFSNKFLVWGQSFLVKLGCPSIFYKRNILGYVIE